MILLEELDIAKLKLSRPTNVFILSHRNPDGDALGSSLGLSQVLRSMGHKTQVVAPSDYPEVYNFLPGIQELMIYDHQKETVINALNNAEVLINLDFNSLDRVDPLGVYIQSSTAYKMMIDHHLDPEPFSDFYLSDTDASSTSELVFRFLQMIGKVDLLNVDGASCLFTGIITDTGSFKYATNPEVYRIASELKAIGVNDYDINDKIFNSWTENQMRILGHALRNRLELLAEVKTGIVALTRQDYLKYQIGRGDTEGIVNYILMIKGIEVAVFIREMPTGEIRLSFRSKYNISVQELARDHFKGGGHINASGGNSELTLQETINKVKRVIPFYLQ